MEHGKNKRNWTRSDFLNDIKICMGGRVAEEIIYGEASVGASTDIQKATGLVRDMVELYGFSDKVGFMALGHYTNSYLDGDYVSTCSQGMREVAEQAENEILRQCYTEVQSILGMNKKLILIIAKKLFDQNEILGSEMERIFSES